MGYSTNYNGEMKFKNELTAKQLAHLNKIIGEDCREFDSQYSKKSNWYYLSLELTKEYDGLKWDGSEKTNCVEDMLNYITEYMRKAGYSDFELTGKMECQGEEVGDYYFIEMISGVACVQNVVVQGDVVLCPHCGLKFILTDEHIVKGK